MEIREIEQRNYEAARDFGFTVSFDAAKQRALLNEFSDIIGPLQVGDLRDLFEEFWASQIRSGIQDNFEYLFSDYRDGELIDKIKENWGFESAKAAHNKCEYFAFIPYDRDRYVSEFVEMFTLCLTLWEYLAQCGLLPKTLPCYLLDRRIWGLNENELPLIIQRLTGFLLLWSFIKWTVEVSDKR